METFEPSEHPASVGSYSQIKLFRYSYRVDAEWESYTVHEIQPRGQSFATGSYVRYLPAIVHLLIHGL